LEGEEGMVREGVGWEAQVKVGEVGEGVLGMGAGGLVAQVKVVGMRVAQGREGEVVMAGMGMVVVSWGVLVRVEVEVG
jgi:hypothetical protein